MTVPADDPLLREALERPTNREILDGAVRQAWGSEARWELREGEAAVSAPDADPASDPAVDHPIVQSALDLFGGTIEAVEERPADD